MTIVLWVIGILVALYVFAWADLLAAKVWGYFSPKSLQPKFTAVLYNKDGRTGITTVYLPGILARGFNQTCSTDSYGSVYTVMVQRSDRVVMMDYPRYFFSQSVIVQELKKQLLYELANNNHVVVVGASMGADLFRDTFSSSEELQALRSRITLVAVDAPAGSATLLPGTRKGLIFEKFVPLGRGLLLGAIPFRVAASGLPKAGEVQPGLDLQKLQAQAKVNLSGFNLRNLLEQGVYLLNFNIDHPSPYYMPSVYYIMCTKGNVDVLQPPAKNAWSLNSNEFLVYCADTPHCAFLQQPRIFVHIFNRIYDKIRLKVFPVV